MSNDDDLNYFPYPTGNLEQIFRGVAAIMNLDDLRIQNPKTLRVDMYLLSEDLSNPAKLWFCRKKMYNNVNYWVTYTEPIPESTYRFCRLITVKERNDQQKWQQDQHENAGSKQWPVIEDKIIACSKLFPDENKACAAWAEATRKRLFPDRGGLYDPVRETFEKGRTREIPTEKLYETVHDNLGQSSAQVVPQVPANLTPQEKGKGVDDTATNYPSSEQGGGNDNGGATYIGKGKGVDRSGGSSTW